MQLPTIPAVNRRRWPYPQPLDVKTNNLVWLSFRPPNLQQLLPAALPATAGVLAPPPWGVSRGRLWSLGQSSVFLSVLSQNLLVGLGCASLR